VTISLDRMTTGVALLALCVALAPLCLATEPVAPGVCHHHVGLIMRKAPMAPAEMSAGLGATRLDTDSVSRAGALCASRVSVPLGADSHVSSVRLRI
jgi:hypothetical protein